MASKAKLETAMEGLDELKQKQILAEIRSIRLQYILAIVGVIGSVLAFVVIQRNNIKDLFTKESRLFYLSDENFVNAYAVVVVKDVKGEIKVNTTLSNTAKGIVLEPGSYSAGVKIDSQRIWSESFTLAKNEIRKIALPKFFASSIKVVVENGRPVVQPGDKIDVSISASGNGYLWIFEILDTETKILFPTTESQDKNYITAGDVFAFPEGLALFAGPDAKMEKYLFLVTSFNDMNYAEDILHMLYKKDIAKGDVKSIEQTWGKQELQVEVKK